MFIEPCLPTISRTVPTGAGWAYEIKHDGDGRVKLFASPSCDAANGPAGVLWMLYRG
jgi:hypothetical protein